MKTMLKRNSCLWGCDGCRAPGFSRRHLLKVGGLGLLGLTLPRLLWAEEHKKGPKARAKAVIFLFQFGGPGPLEMFDMKPDAPEQIRRPRQPSSSNSPGTQGNWHFRRRATRMGKATLMRASYHTRRN